MRAVQVRDPLDVIADAFDEQFPPEKRPHHMRIQVDLGEGERAWEALGKRRQVFHRGVLFTAIPTRIPRLEVDALPQAEVVEQGLLPLMDALSFYVSPGSSVTFDRCSNAVLLLRMAGGTEEIDGWGYECSAVCARGTVLRATGNRKQKNQGGELPPPGTPRHPVVLVDGIPAAAPECLYTGDAGDHFRLLASMSMYRAVMQQLPWKQVLKREDPHGVVLLGCGSGYLERQVLDTLPKAPQWLFAHDLRGAAGHPELERAHRTITCRFERLTRPAVIRDAPLLAVLVGHTLGNQHSLTAFLRSIRERMALGPHDRLLVDIGLAHPEDPRRTNLILPGRAGNHEIAWYRAAANRHFFQYVGDYIISLRHRVAEAVDGYRCDIIGTLQDVGQEAVLISRWRWSVEGWEAIFDEAGFTVAHVAWGGRAPTETAAFLLRPSA